MADGNSTKDKDFWGNEFWKPCSMCKKAKPLGAFDRSKNGPLGRQSQCRQCKALHKKKMRRENPDKVRKKGVEEARKHKYKISTLAFEAMFAKQNGLCAICMAPLKKGVRGKEQTNIDHCHRTKTVRGLLCNACNPGLGLFRDSPVLLRAAADYLERHL